MANGAADGLKWHEGETRGSRADLGVFALKCFALKKLAVTYTIAVA